MTLVHCDHLDRSIVALLQSDARMSFRTIGARLDTCEATIRWRVRRLKDQKLIELRVFTSAQEPSPKNLEATVTLEFQQNLEAELIAYLSSLPEVTVLFDCAGSSRLTALIEPQAGCSVSDALAKLSNAPGLTGMTSELALKIIKPLTMKLVQSCSEVDGAKM